MAELRLESAIFGMSNINQPHVHRHNQLFLDSNQVNQMKLENMGGGLKASTLNSMAALSGSLSSQAQGVVNLEGGWNERRGLGMLEFIVTQNGLMEERLSIVGYLTGGAASQAGIEGHTLFVPVRSWSTLSRNQQNPVDGMDYTTMVVNESSQFLMGDPLHQRSLKSLRPIDIADAVVGVTAAEQEGRGDYGGVIGNDLESNGVTVSKTQNLNPSFHSRELLRMAAKGIGETADQYGTQYALSDAMTAPGFGEMYPTENPFIRVMQATTGGVTMRGFQGYSISEINNTFANFADVLNLQLLNEGQYTGINHTETCNEYGSSGMGELLGSELAYLTMHTLMDTGLTSYCFSATNDIMELDGMVTDGGVGYVPGASMSVFPNDMEQFQRTMNFQEAITNSFFSKLNGTSSFNRQPVRVSVQSHLFGETVVEIALGPDYTTTRRYANATFAINRHSTNIGANEIAVAQANNFYQNIQAYLK